MFLSQLRLDDGSTGVVVRNGTEASLIKSVSTTYELVRHAIESGAGIAQTIRRLDVGASVDLAAFAERGRLLCPITHPDPAHMHLTGTGLTHLGSASARDAMHAANMAEAQKLTDSMRMFQMGLEGGKPAPGTPGVQPEWFYKGNGLAAVPPGGTLLVPPYGDDGGEEPEIAGIYVIGGDGTPFRVGFSLSNEFSDHVMERVNYLYLAHSKLRQASFGPEIRIGELPQDLRGTSRIRRGGEVIFEQPFLSGEANMSHTIANLEHHHFKYDIFRQPGDVHVHMFGTATLSFAHGIRCEDADEFEISMPEFGLALRNRLAVDASPDRVATTRGL